MEKTLRNLLDSIELLNYMDITRSYKCHISMEYTSDDKYQRISSNVTATDYSEFIYNFSCSEIVEHLTNCDRKSVDDESDDERFFKVAEQVSGILGDLEFPFNFINITKEGAVKPIMLPDGRLIVTVTVEVNSKVKG